MDSKKGQEQTEPETSSRLDYECLYTRNFGKLQVYLHGKVAGFPKWIEVIDHRGNTAKYTLGSGYHDT